jgi:mono/diheme cytochrome c family protein
MKPSKLIALTFIALASIGASLPAFAAEPAPQFDGKWRYNTSCAGCHGADGAGWYGFGPALRGNAFIQNAPAPAIIEVIQKGRRYAKRTYPEYIGMPPFDAIRAGEADALVAYLKGGLQK